MVRGLLLLLFMLMPALAGAGVLSGEVLWEGQVEVAEPLRVEGVLVVAPGTEVRFAAGSGLEVTGSMVTDDAVFGGRGWTGIVLKGCDETTRLRNSRVEGAGTGIVVQGGAPRLESLTVSGNRIGMELRQKSAATVSGCLFRDNSRVGLFVKDGATAAVSGCSFIGNGRYGAYIYRASPRLFSGNRSEGNPTGLMISHYGSDPTIADNRIAGNEIGVLVDRAARPLLTGNRLEGNGTGMRIYRRSDPRIEGNLLTGNGVAVSVAYSSYPRIKGNDFHGNATALQLEYQSSAWERERGDAVRETEAASRSAFGRGRDRTVGAEQRRPEALTGSVDARGNFWGEDGTAELARIGVEGNPSFIDDGRDSPTFVDAGRTYPLDIVRFAPWQDAPRTGEERR